MEIYRFCMDLHGFKLILHRFIWIWIDVAWIYVDSFGFSVDLYRFMLTHMRVNMFMHVLNVFMSLVWAVSLPQTFFSDQKGHSRICWTMSLLEIVRIVRISVFIDFGTCLKARAPEIHEFWQY